MENERKLEIFVEELEKISPKEPMVRIIPYRGDTTVFSSKLGGVPYLPKNMEYPVVREGRHAGKPLHLLAQLNFSEIPHIEGFPKSGILQFFAGCDGDEVIGMDFDDGYNQNCFRVLFHEQVITDESQLISAADMPEFYENDYIFPFKGEFALRFGEMSVHTYVSSSDYRFDEYACKAYNAVFDRKVSCLFSKEDSIDELNPEFCEMMFDDGRLIADGSKIGGYPFFTQSDPRGDDERYEECDVMLLQIDSGGEGEDEIMWGDSGVANFFISSRDLAKRDFSKVLYNWDCC